MNKTMTKVLSFVLALALVAAFAPAGVISNADAADWAGAEAQAAYLFQDGSDGSDILAKYPDYNATNKNPNWYVKAYNGMTSTRDFWGYGHRLTISSQTGWWVAYSVKLPATPGMYTLSVQKDTSIGANLIDVYAMPADATVADSLTEANLVGTLEYTTASQVAEAGALTVTDAMANGDYVIVLKVNANAVAVSGSNRTLETIHNIKLDGTANDKLASIDATADKDIIPTGGSANINISAKYNTGADADLTGAQIAYESSDDDIATVADGVITQVGDGPVTITVSVTLNGVTKKDTIEIKRCGDLTWAGAGATTVYNFKTVTNEDNQMQVGIFSDYNKFNNTNWYVVEQLPAYHTNKGNSGISNHYGNGHRVWQAYNWYIAYSVKLPTTPGLYTIDVNQELAGSTWVDVYAFPTSATVADSFTAANYIGTTDVTRAVDPCEAGVITVDEEMAGKDYIIALKSNDGATPIGGNAKSITNITLDGAANDKLASVEASAAAELEIGGETTVTVTGKLNTGKAANLAGAQVSFATEDDAVTVNATTGAVTAVKAGTATITATVTKDGITVTDTVAITVKEAVAATDFTGNASSGYYTDGEVKEGVIAFSAIFNKYNEIEIESYGFWVYEEGHEDAELNNGKIEVKSTNGTLADGWFNVKVTGIEEADFGRTAVAVPFVVIDGDVYFGNAIDSTTADSWLGEVPAAE